MRMRWTRHRDWRDASYPVRFLSKVRLAFVAECASMLQFVFRRTLWIIPVLITISLITSISISVAIFGFVFGVALGLPLGILAAVRHNTWLDYVSLFVSTLFVSTPGFVLAIFLMIIFGLWLKWLPIAARTWNTWQPWLLPSFCLGVGLSAFIARLTRATMLEVLRQDYIRTARAKGLAQNLILIRHALRNSMIPVATVLGPALAGLVTGSFFIESMFSFPGMGRMFVQAIGQRDYSVILGTTLLYAGLIAVANLTVDIVYAWLDPRISYK
ncbi:MAG: ABC transporter permease [Proteobacteria bacterium]|nr:ABC transporter permease [Pseudomonadota bacterium]